jgi:hypothetical protein
VFTKTLAHYQIIKLVILISFLFFVFFSYSQVGTRISKKTTINPVGKIMLIPFEPKLYMSDIDRKINEETKWHFEQIRENFRHQLEIQLKLKLQSTAPVVSFYSDSIKTWKDLSYIYKSTSLSFDLISDPNGTKTKPAETSGIKNGQVEVEINTDKKFMNLKIDDSKLLDYLNKKYKTDYFVFINQLDIKNEVDSYDIATDTYQRDVTVHYSIYNKMGKNILAGISTSHFNSKENDPEKIILHNFSPIASDIAAKFTTIVKPEPLNKSTSKATKGMK